MSTIAGSLNPATAKKAAKGDVSILAEVDAFLGNPAAVALWGDLGRRLLQRWIEVYGGDCLTTRRAVWRFASDLRAELAGQNPTPLDYLVAERVVIGWIFLHYCETIYARQVTKLTWKEMEFHTKRIEMANRNLMSAARTLAKVKKSKMPDVLALVNVNPPTAGPA